VDLLLALDKGNESNAQLFFPASRISRLRRR
jgi:hypothetical protein